MTELFIVPESAVFENPGSRPPGYELFDEILIFVAAPVITPMFAPALGDEKSALSLWMTTLPPEKFAPVIFTEPEIYAPFAIPPGLLKVLT